MGTTDADLIVRIATRRDREALSELYDRHAPACVALAERVLGDRAHAEDVVQEVFVKVWDQPGAYRPERGNVRAWLVTTVRSRAIDALRRDRTHERAKQRASDRLDMFAAPPPRTATTVGRAVASLPLDQRLVIELAYFEGLTQTEIAERLDVPLGTTKSRLRLALNKLKGTFTRRRDAQQDADA